MSVRTRIHQGIFISLGAVAILLTSPSSAMANSIVSSSPSAGSVLVTAPNAVTITTAASLMDQGNTVTVTDSQGARVDDGSLAISDVTAIVGMKPITQTGVYTVSYNLLALNDTPLTGTFTFVYNAPAVITTPTPTATPTLLPVPSTNTSTDSLIIVLLVASGVIFLLLVWYAIYIIREFKNRKPKRK